MKENDTMEDPAVCFACESNRSEEAYRSPAHVGDVRVRVCLDCGMAYAWPRMNPSEQRSFHDEDYDDFASTGLWSNAEIFERRLRDQLNFLESYTEKPGRVLELGSFRGDLLYGLSRIGWECSGVEPASQSCEWIAREWPALRMHQGVLEDEPFAGETFDLIVLSQMLEHVVSPVETLRSLHRYAHEGTQLFVEELSLEALLDTPGSSLGKNFTSYRGGLFSTRSLFDVLDRSGWGAPRFFGEIGRAQAGLDVIRAMAGPKEFVLRENVRLAQQTMAAYQNQVDRFYGGMVERVNSIVASGQRVVCWGAGELGQHLVQSTTLGSAPNFAGWVEGVAGREGNEVLGHPVHAPGDLDSLEPEAVVIASLAFADEIEEQLAVEYQNAESLEVLRF